MAEPEETKSESSEPAAAAELVPVPAVHPATPPAMPVQPWAAPLLRLDLAWARFEAKLATVVLVAELVSLVAWVILKGLGAGYEPGSGDRSGLVLRGVLGAVVLGSVVYVATKNRLPEQRRSLVTTVVVLVALFGARVWANAGAEYFSNLLNWLQSSSALTLVGGLSGVVTRLTLWLALLGGAMATSQGKHITVDVVMRFLTPRLRVLVAVIGWIAASIVCTAAVWGFVDDIAIAHFLAPPDGTPREKVAHVTHEMGTDLFLLRRQIALDFKSAPHVLAGQKYNEWLHGPEWNEWLRGGGWTAHFAPDDVKSLELPEGDTQSTRNPIVGIPGSAENVPGLLVRDFDLILPFGLFVLALRFLLRAILALTGHVRVDPDAAHGDEDIEAAQSALHGAKGTPSAKGAA